MTLPHSKFYIALHYLEYFINAESWQSVQSPFNYNLAKAIAKDKLLNEFSPIEKRRKALCKNNSNINVIDYGKSGAEIKSKIASVASSSLKPKKYARLLYRLVKHTNSNTILELGTSFGISTSYMAMANKEAKVITIEGSESISKIAQENYSILNLKNIHQVTGSFENTLSSTLNYISQLDLVFIDGHHQKEATLNYFETCLVKANDKTLFIFDDINWSADMQNAWLTLKNHPQSTLTIDLFMMGLLFINPALSKQNIVLRY